MSVEDVLAKLDGQWTADDWDGVIASLQFLQNVAPDELDYTDKLYVAYFNAGISLLAEGDTAGAAVDFSRAEGTDPSRGEAREEILALTPTPIPTATATLAPTESPVPAPTAAPASYGRPYMGGPLQAFIQVLGQPRDEDSILLGLLVNLGECVTRNPRDRKYHLSVDDGRVFQIVRNPMREAQSVIQHVFGGSQILLTTRCNWRKEIHHLRWLSCVPVFEQTDGTLADRHQMAGLQLEPGAAWLFHD
jgi:hypothetical protein